VIHGVAKSDQRLYDLGLDILVRDERERQLSRLNWFYYV
jgi:hypothetical protein